jgi:tRNA (guanine37-N1)-methyltransferase
MFPAFLDHGMVRVARERGLLDVEVIDLREFTKDKHRTTDDAPFGGGVGMVMLAEPLFAAVEAVAPEPAGRHVVLLTPQGRAFRQDDARRLSTRPHLVLLCGRYKGVDERVADRLVDEELSLGDFVLSGGEPAALCVVDAIARLLPGVLGDFDSAESDSFHSGLLDCAYYTRPATFRDAAVPEVLLSGDHGKIARWRRENALLRTYERRPDLLTGASLDEADRKFLRRLAGEKEKK